MSNVTSSSLSGGVSGLPTANKDSLPTDSIASTAGVRSPVMDSSIQRCKNGCVTLKIESGAIEIYKFEVKCLECDTEIILRYD